VSTTLIRRGLKRLHPEEVELLARARSGDFAAFEQLAGAHIGLLFRTAQRLVDDRADAEDIVQETLLRAWRGIGDFRGRSGISTWLYRITVNEANRSLGKGARRPETVRLGDEQLELSSSPDEGPAQQAQHKELQAELRMALLALPVPYRTAVVLRDVEGLSTREAAQVAGVGEAAFKSRLHQGRLGIRAALGDDALIAAGS
jgi:RNA polymerase sigma-70 factor, ECF subfamily